MLRRAGDGGGESSRAQAPSEEQEAREQQVGRRKTKPGPLGPAQPKLPSARNRRPDRAQEQHKHRRRAPPGVRILARALMPPHSGIQQAFIYSDCKQVRRHGAKQMPLFWNTPPPVDGVAVCSCPLSRHRSVVGLGCVLRGRKWAHAEMPPKNRLGTKIAIYNANGSGSFSFVPNPYQRDSGAGYLRKDSAA